MTKKDKKKTILRLHNSEIRAMLFQHGVVFVEGPSDRMVLEKIDRFMSDHDMKGPNIEDNEWMVLDVGGKDSMPLMINLAKKLKIPYTSVMDYDSLMQCTKRIEINENSVRTSSVIYYIEKTEKLTNSEKKLIKKLEESNSRDKSKIRSHNGFT